MEVPKKGGEIFEIEIGERPLFINPVLAFNSVDKTLVSLVYSSLLERDEEGKIIPGIVYYSISDEGKVYNLILDDDIYFSNGKKLTVDDIIFTIKKIQDPLLKSPYYGNWLGVKTEKVNDFEMNIILPEEYYQFDNILADLYIMPKDAWIDISPSEFPFSPLNLKPIGSGSYKVFKVNRNKNNGKIEKIILILNDKYHKESAFIEKINFVYFDDFDDFKESDLYSNKKIIKNISGVDYDKINEFSENYIKANIKKLDNNKIFGIFLGKNYNLDLSNLSLRRFIANSIDKEKIVDNILKNNVELKNDILFFDILEENKEKEGVENKDYLKNSPFKIGENGWLINKKNNKKVSLKISTLNSDELKKVAESVKNDLEKVGIETEILLYQEDRLINDVIRNRKFEILIFGYQFDSNPDYYYSFHSSQISDPGINIAEISNKKIDEVLLKLRKNSLEKDERIKLMNDLNKMVLDDYSFIPLYKPYIIYIFDSRIKNFNKKFLNEISDRMNDVYKWYILTKKIIKWKNF